MIKEIKETFNVKDINLSCVVYRDFVLENKEIDDK